MSGGSDRSNRNAISAIDPRTNRYIQSLSQMRESKAQSRLRQATANLPDAIMQIGIDQGQLMAVLALMVGAKRAIEVGVFTGYSALCVAQHLPPDGKLVACDISQEWTAIGQPFWAEAEVQDRIDLKIGPAAETLAALIDAGEANSYDFAFIDADKDGYDGYYEQCLTLVRSGGAIAMDNIFMQGRALESNAEDRAATAVHALTRKIFADERGDPAVIPIGDGMLLARKR